MLNGSLCHSKMDAVAYLNSRISAPLDDEVA